MDDQERRDEVDWESDQVWGYLEASQLRLEQLIERRQRLASSSFEERAILEEQRWRREHPYG
jgi:hypothetical protein